MSGLIRKDDSDLFDVSSTLALSESVEPAGLGLMSAEEIIHSSDSPDEAM